MRAGSADGDDGKRGDELFDASDEVAAGHVADTGVEDNAIDLGEAFEGFDGFFGAVGGDDVKLGGFDDQLAGGDTARVLAVDDQKTGTDHGFDYLPLKRLVDGLLVGDERRCDEPVVRRAW